MAWSVPPVYAAGLHRYILLFSTRREREISMLKNTFGEETAGALLSFSMMRWGYQTPINRSLSEHLNINAVGYNPGMTFWLL
jgi:hypothetical protein